jgi:hypothetical protein
MGYHSIHHVSLLGTMSVGISHADQPKQHINCWYIHAVLKQTRRFGELLYIAFTAEIGYSQQ